MSRATTSADSSRMVALFLNRPVSVFMGFLALLVIGGIAYDRIPLQLFPSGYTPRNLSIWISLPDSTPGEVEQKITRPLERVLGTIGGIERLTTHSSGDGCSARIQFDDSISADDAYMQVWDRLDRVAAELPDDARPPTVRRFNPDDFPIAFIGVSLREDGDDAQLRNERLFDRIENRLMRIDGVARVQIMGGYATSVDIDVQQDLIEGMGVNLYELVQKLQQDNFQLGAGDIREGNTNHKVRSIARFESVEDLLSYPVRKDLRLGELAMIRSAYALQNRVVRINGQRSLCLLVNKQSDTNTIAVAKAVREAIANDLPADPVLSDFQFHMLWDQGESIVASIDNLKKTILEGACVAILVLLFFLRHLRMTAIVMLAIPISMLAAVAMMYFVGESLNLISLMGLTLGVGMLVDNSVVVVESIKGRAEAGDPPSVAALVGTSRVALAVLIATSTTIVVFVPMMVTGDDGIMRFFLIRLGLPVCLALTASLVVAMVLIPPACRFLLAAGPAEPSEPSQRLHARALRKLGWLVAGAVALSQRAYAWLLAIAIHRRLEVLLIAAAVFYLAMFEINVPQTDLNEGEQREFAIEVRMPDQYNLRKANDLFIRLEKLLLAQKAELDIKSLFSSFGSGRGEVRVFLNEADAMKVHRADVLTQVKALMPQVPGVRLRVGHEENSGGTRNQMQELPIVLTGRDTQRLAELATEVARLLEGIPGIESVSNPLDDAQVEIHMKINRELAQRYGVDTRTAAGMISYSFRGQFLPKLRTGDRELYLRIQMERNSDPTLDEVKALLIPTVTGTRVPLGAIATFERHRSYDTIYREDRKTVLRISARGKVEDMHATASAIDARLSRLNFPEGYGYKKSGRFDEMRKQKSTFNYGAILAVALVFFLMGFLFESWLLPLAILFSIPFAFVGVHLILNLTNTPMDTMVYLGMIVLIGVVINNGVVLIDRVHQLRPEIPDRSEAILAGCAERYRPIMMTALTTIGGLLPMAMGTSNATGIPYFPLGRTVIGGLTAATIMTLFVVPVMYALLDDLGRFGRAVLARRGPADPTA